MDEEQIPDHLLSEQIVYFSEQDWLTDSMYEQSGIINPNHELIAEGAEDNESHLGQESEERSVADPIPSTSNALLETGRGNNSNQNLFDKAILKQKKRNTS